MSWQKPSYGDNPFQEIDTPVYNQSSSFIGTEKKDQAPLPPWIPNDTPKSNSSHGLLSQPPIPQNQGYVPPVAQQSTQPPAPQEIDPNVPRMIMYTRVINLVLSILMVLASLLSLLTTNNATNGVLACYVVVFSCLLCCFEAHLKQISKFIAMNFGFMYSARSRSVFMFFIGTIMFSFSLFGKIIGLLMLGNAGFNMYILWKYPQYEEAQRKDATSEISDFLSAHPAFAQKFAAMGVQAIASNPDIARQAATAYFGGASTPPTAPPTSPSPSPYSSPYSSLPTAPSTYSPPIAPPSNPNPYANHSI